jgi:hypothetical protein
VLTIRTMSPYPQSRLDAIDRTDPFQVDRLIRSLEDEAYTLVRDGDNCAGKMIFMNLPVLYRLREDLLSCVPVGSIH